MNDVKTSIIELIYKIGMMIFWITYIVYICSVFGTIPLGQLTILDFIVPALIIYIWMVIICTAIMILYIILLAYCS